MLNILKFEASKTTKGAHDKHTMVMHWKEGYYVPEVLIFVLQGGMHARCSSLSELYMHGHAVDMGDCYFHTKPVLIMRGCFLMGKSL